jgi:hypothetical protein
VLDFFCHRSGLEDALRDERARGNAAAVDFVKAPPDCTVGQALEAWLIGAELERHRDLLA